VTLAAAVALVLGAGACGRGTDSPREHARDPAAPVDADVASLRAELDSARARIAELEVEIEAATASRLAREEEWMRYTKALAQLHPAATATEATFQPMPGLQAAAPGAPEPGAEDPAGEAVESAARRDREIATALGTLFTVDQVTGFELLESGTLSEGATGPVVLRALDDRGRPLATLAARRLRLEGSRAARTVTLVLEDGYERRGGEKLAFEGPRTEEGRGGAKRIELPAIDPGPWIEALPELFREEDRAEPADDGLWELGSVRAALNLLLREDVTAGWWRLVALGGVEAGVLRDVQLDGLDQEGRLERKLFADRMQVFAQEKGVRIELTDGAQLRGDAKTPFLDGRYRIFLPRASVEAWTKAGIPGLSEPPAR